jgi:hypothetical protein
MDYAIAINLNSKIKIYFIKRGLRVDIIDKYGKIYMEIKYLFNRF